MKTKAIMLFAAPLAAVVLFFLMRYSGIEYVIAITAAITLLTATWWVTETIPIPATSLIPFFAFPLADVLTHREAAAGLGSPVILLVDGRFHAGEIPGKVRRTPAFCPGDPAYGRRQR